LRTPYGRRPPARAEAGVSLLAETPVVPTHCIGEAGGGLSTTASGGPPLHEANLTTRPKNATTAPMRATDQTSSSSRPDLGQRDSVRVGTGRPRWRPPGRSLVEGRDDVPGQEGQDREDDDHDRGVLDRRVSGETG